MIFTLFAAKQKWGKENKKINFGLKSWNLSQATNSKMDQKHTQ